MRIKHFILTSILLFASLCIAQDAIEKHHIVTKDGNTYIGQIMSQDSLSVRLKADKLGEITLQKIDIKKQTLVDEEKVKDDKYWFDNPQSTRYFFSPNAYGLEKGEGYYQNVWVLMNSCAYGLTDNFSIGGGLVPLFLFAGTSSPVWITPKISVPISKDKVNLGGGVLLGSVVGETDTEFGIAYGISTFGNRDKNITIGLGYGFANGDWAKSPMVNLNAMYRIGPRSYLLTENFFIQTDEDIIAFLSVGEDI